MTVYGLPIITLFSSPVSSLPVYDVVLVQVLDTLQDLACVLAEHGLIEGPKPRQDAGDGPARHKLHEDAHYAVLQARSQVPDHDKTTTCGDVP